MHTISISPITRANSVGAVTVTVEGGKIVEARSEGTIFRGFEQIMEGRDPRDAPYLTQRICGICSSAHGLAACHALENLAGAAPLPPNAVLTRNLIYGCDLVQNHLRHFYVLGLWDWVEPPAQYPFQGGYTRDFRLGPSLTAEMHEHYWQGIEQARLAHEALTLMGGKTPHNHGLVPGGVSFLPRGEILEALREKLARLEKFTEEIYLPDARVLREFYPEYLHLGTRPHAGLSFGMFPDSGAPGSHRFPARVLLEGGAEPLDLAAIDEITVHSWYRHSADPLSRRKTVPDLSDPRAYSWIKAPRYRGAPCQGGPLTRKAAAGRESAGENSVLDRIAARAEETLEVIRLMINWAEELDPCGESLEPVRIPAAGSAAGAIDAMRGPLLHWVTVRDGRIANYQIITPSSWNFSPRDGRGRPGPAEEALLGLPVEDPAEPVEVGRVIRSFDPCYACSAHVIDLRRGNRKVIRLP